MQNGITPNSIAGMVGKVPIILSWSSHLSWSSVSAFQDISTWNPEKCHNNISMIVTCNSWKKTTFFFCGTQRKSSSSKAMTWKGLGGAVGVVNDCFLAPNYGLHKLGAPGGPQGGFPQLQCAPVAPGGSYGWEGDSCFMWCDDWRPALDPWGTGIFMGNL